MNICWFCEMPIHVTASLPLISILFDDRSLFFVLFWKWVHFRGNTGSWMWMSVLLKCKLSACLCFNCKIAGCLYDQIINGIQLGIIQSEASSMNQQPKCHFLWLRLDWMMSSGRSSNLWFEARFSGDSKLTCLQSHTHIPYQLSYRSKTDVFITDAMITKIHDIWHAGAVQPI